MIKDKEIERWLKCSHYIFEIFEGRHDAYSLATKWIKEYFERGKFSVSKNEIERLRQIKNNFDIKIFKVSNSIKGIIEKEMENLLEKFQKDGEEIKNIGYGISFYLFTWNFIRYKVYFNLKKQKFSLSSHFEKLGEFIEKQKIEFVKFRQKNILNDNIEDPNIKEIFDKVNNKLKYLGINQNESTGTAKLLHILAPYYFPLIDKNIAEAIGVKQRGVTLTVENYLDWMHSLKEWITSKRHIESLSEKFDISPLKLIDEGLYIMCSMRLSRRVPLLGFNIMNK